MSKPQQCKEEVSDRWTRWPRFYQCKRAAVKDGYCKQHHPDAVAKRRVEADERWKAKFKAHPVFQLIDARKEIAALKSEIERLKAELERLKP